MSAVRNHEGVLLHYGDDFFPALSPHIRSDRERVMVLRAERELRTIAVIADHLAITSVGRDRIEDSLRIISIALALTRLQLEMPRPTAARTDERDGADHVHG